MTETIKRILRWALCWPAVLFATLFQGCLFGDWPFVRGLISFINNPHDQ